MSQPKVSVIITTYNRADYLSYAIDSVLNQTFQDFELIIIDDGSTDETYDLVNRYQNERIRYHYQENRGQNPARNIGMELANGEYIAHLDSDDIWVSTKLEKQVNILRNNQNIGLVYCGTQLIDGLNNIIGTQPIIIHNGNVLDKLLMTNFLYNGSCAIFRKDCLEKVGFFDESFKRMTDWEFYLKFAIYYKFFGINEYLLQYRIHNETMSKDFNSYKTYGIKILEKIFNHKDIDPKYLKLKNRAIALRYRYMGRRYLENKLKEEAREGFFEALKTDPTLCYQSDSFILLMSTYLPLNFIEQLRNIKRTLKSAKSS
ncbi:MAG: glycosyl transferase family protein [uncultured bacterium]|nr:MAG: glycosyl transferase family protein [uncultured bacterium]HBH18505.1 glycosyl transferase family A [Cyanobacteria bacterium UBA9579]